MELDAVFASGMELDVVLASSAKPGAAAASAAKAGTLFKNVLRFILSSNHSFVWHYKPWKLSTATIFSVIFLFLFPLAPQFYPNHSFFQPQNSIPERRHIWQAAGDPRLVADRAFVNWNYSVEKVIPNEAQPSRGICFSIDFSTSIIKGFGLVSWV
jgi:hypothetical protein